jgi:hypothetical protein
MFRPARARIQVLSTAASTVAKYDAVRTVEAFLARLRDEVDLEAMRRDLLTVVQETMKPARASLWFKH